MSQEFQISKRSTREKVVVVKVEEKAEEAGELVDFSVEVSY